MVQRIYSKDPKGIWPATPSVGEGAIESHDRETGPGVRIERGDMAAGGSLIGDPANPNHNAGGILVPKPDELKSSSWAEALQRRQLGRLKLGPTWAAQVGPAVSGGELKAVTGRQLKALSGGELKKKPPVDLVVQTIRKDHGERQRMAAAREMKKKKKESGDFEERQKITAATRGPLLDGKEERAKEVKEKEEKDKEVKEKGEKDREVKEKGEKDKEVKEKEEKEKVERKKEAKEKEEHKKEVKGKEKREKEARERKGKEATERETQVKGKGPRENRDLVAGGTLIGKQAKRLIARTLKVGPPVREVKEKSTSGKALWRDLARNKLANNPGKLAISQNIDLKTWRKQKLQ